MGELIDKAKGKAKQIQGIVTGNDDRRAEGEIQELKGKAKGVANKVESAARKVVASVKRAARKI